MINKISIFVLIFSISICSTWFVSAVAINNPDLPSVTQPTSSGSTTNIYTNNSYLNQTIVNGSSYNDSYALYSYNGTQPAIDYVNAQGFNSTFNISYQTFAYNMTDGNGMTWTNNITLTSQSGRNLTILQNNSGFVITQQTNAQGNYGTGLNSLTKTGGAINTTFTGWNETAGSISFWINSRDAGSVCDSNVCTIINSATTGGDGAILIRYTNGNSLGWNFNGKSTATTPTLNTWIYYVMTWNVTADKGMVYQNGVNVANLSSPLSSPGHSIQLAVGGNGVSSRVFNATMDELVIYANRVLSPAEVLSNYNSGIGTLTANDIQGATGVYHFDEASGNYLDSTANKNNLLLNANFGRTTGIVRLTSSITSSPILECVDGINAGETAICYLGADKQRTYIRGSEIFWGNSTMSFGSIDATDITAIKFSGDGSGLTNIGADRNAIVFQSGDGSIKSNNSTGLFYNELKSLLSFFGWTPSFNITDSSTGYNTMIVKEPFKNKLTMSTEVNNDSTSISNGIVMNGLSGGAGSNTFTGWNGSRGSISVWINASTTTCGGTICTIVNSNNAGSDGTIYIRMQGTLTFRFNGVSINTAITTQNWTHLAMTWDSSANQFKAYNNGVLITTGTATAFTSPTTISVGALNSGGQRFFNGTMDELAIYKDRALTQSDIDRLYNNGTGWKVPDRDLGIGALYHFDEASGNALDSSGNANTLSVVTWARGTGKIINNGTRKNLDFIVCEDGQIAGENGICTFGDVNSRTLIQGQNITIKGTLKVEGNVSFKRAYWTGYDNSTQSFIDTAVAQVINISNNGDYDNYGINIVGNQNLTFSMTGDYQCTLSPEFYQATGSNKMITFWIQKNGQDIPWSNSRYTMANGQYLAPSIVYQFDIENPSTDNIRFMWWSDSTASQIISIGALTSPTRPSIPGVLLNCLKASEITP